MDRSVYWHVRNLELNLEKAGISPEIMSQILEGGDQVTRNTSQKKKAKWMREAMERMDHLLDEKVRFKVREDCACCTTGSRLKLIKQLRREHPDLDAFVEAVDSSHIFGRKVEKEGNTIFVQFGDSGSKCVCLPKNSAEPFSITYCHCCKGHIIKLLEAALKRPLSGDVLASACSGGDTCRFAIYLDDAD